MRRVLSVLLACSIISGCSTTKQPDTILTDFASVVFDDGISQEEAIFISKKEAKDKTPPQSYLIDQPKVITEFENVPNQEDFWFVSFPEMEKSSVPDVYMVILRKDTGKIIFSRAFVPENEWILEAFILKLYEKQKNITP